MALKLKVDLVPTFDKTFGDWKFIVPGSNEFYLVFDKDIIEFYIADDIFKDL